MNLEQITRNFQQIPIARSAFEQARRYASLVPHSEMYGALLAPAEDNTGIVRSIILANGQEASSADVKLVPEAAAELQTEIENSGFKMIGIWHSHGNFGVFHSGTDNNNMKRLYQSYSLNNQQRESTRQPNGIQFDEQRGIYVVRCGGLCWEVTPEPTAEKKKGRARPEKFQIGPNPRARAVVCMTEDGEMYFRYKSKRCFKTKPLEIHAKPIEEELTRIIGACYSIVVNGAGNSYGEIWGLDYNLITNKKEPFVTKSAKIKIIEDRVKVPDDDWLVRDIRAKVAGLRRSGGIFV